MKRRLKNSVQRRLRKKRKKNLGMSEVVEYLMGVEESLLLDDPDGIVE